MGSFRVSPAWRFRRRDRWGAACLSGQHVDADGVEKAGIMRRKIVEAASTLFPGYLAYVMATGIRALRPECLRVCTSGPDPFSLSPIPSCWACQRTGPSVFQPFFGRTSAHLAGCLSRRLRDGRSRRGRDSFLVSMPLRHRVWSALFWSGPLASVFIYIPLRTVVIVTQVKPAADRSVNGGWLVTVVSTQSRPLSALLSDRPAVSTAAGLFMMGCNVFVAYLADRFSACPTKVEAASRPPYWISDVAQRSPALAGVSRNKHLVLGIQM